MRPNEASASKLLDDFGIRLCAARIAAGYETRKALADAIGVDRNTYTPWERGRSYPTAKTLIDLGARLNVSLDWLMSGDDRNLSVSVYRKISDAMPEAQKIRAGRRSDRD